MSSRVALDWSDLWDRERAWFAALSPTYRTYLAVEPGEDVRRLQQETDTVAYRTRDLGFWGEILFLALELKPCVLLWFGDDTGVTGIEVCEARCASSPRSWVKQIVLDDYVARVIRPGLDSDRYALVQIDHTLASPEMDLRDAYVLYDRTHAAAATVEDYLLNPKRTAVDESVLQTVLDYPGSLPSNPAQVSQLVEVAYGVVDSDSNVSPRWVTSFGALRQQLPAVRQHFSRYQTACRQAGVDLRLAYG
ncbi:hypothetical protein IWQ60_003984 [Tieghemiomyces parasiticus]|uniref:Uncharacterized protein n=1 Tax=Tieghemiomyces parasiticus TaxID=78921 RepID=A0A9W8AEH5_9FUNG|nr:hypothetical protein IWQ60_003984 [Tieghemiomyces parasiticus]